MERTVVFDYSNLPRTTRLAFALRALPWRAIVALLIAVPVTLAGAWYGYHVRQTIFDATNEVHGYPLRFYGDIGNGQNQGSVVVAYGRQLGRERGALPPPPAVPRPRVPWQDFWRSYLARYDRVAAETPAGRTYGLDYVPGRLLIVSLWMKSISETHTGVRGFEDSLAPPMLAVNLAAEIASAVLIAAIVFLWLRRQQRANALAGFRDGGIVRAGILAAAAMLVFWLDPQTILDAHVWPQWDVWVVPFFLAAVLLGSLECWMAAGFAIALGAMFKGQTLFATPLLILWPLFMWRFEGVLRVAIGVVGGGLVLCSAWLLPSAEAWRYVGVALGSVIAVSLLARPVATWLATSRDREGAVDVNDSPSREHQPLPHGRGSLTRPLIVQGSLFVALSIPLFLIAWPFINVDWPVALGLAALASLCLASRRRLNTTALGLLTIGVLFAAADHFGGSWNWLRVGFPTDRYPVLSMGTAFNLPAVLARTYGWSIADVVFTLPAPLGGEPVTMKQLLAGVFFLASALCAFAAARHHRKGDAGFLIAVATPWVLLFTLMPQMHERYLFWGGAITSLCIAAGVGPMLLHFGVTAFSGLMIFGQLLNAHPQTDPAVKQKIAAMYPGAGWMLATFAMTLLVVMFIPRRKSGTRLRGTSVVTAAAIRAIPLAPVECNARRG